MNVTNKSKLKKSWGKIGFSFKTLNECAFNRELL